jgi:O-antigen biosynthesis protein
MVNGRRVLDAACGTGYGSVMLRSAGATYVEGLDLSNSAVLEAKRVHSRDGVAFRQGDLLQMDRPDDPFDIVVSFETIEHIQDDRAYVEAISRILVPGGLLLCSTPNRIVTNPGKSITDQPYNEYHVREYTPDELAALIGSRFAIMQVLGQSLWPDAYCRILARLCSIWPMLPVRVHQLRKLIGLPFDTYERYKPGPIPPKAQAEGLILVARKP